ncbi:MAG: hypothetical protein COA99_14745 [Moraxellaceae bacterium]|nr:MAG: hypothetical protein COA99_14745 [Moraxellaceae bacterium]
MLQAGILYETSEVADSQMPDASISDPTATSIVVNGAFTMDKIVLKVQYGMQTLDLDVDGADDIDTTLIAVGAEHNCTKQTKLYAEYTTLSVDAGGSSEPSSSVFSVGMLHKF